MTKGVNFTNLLSAAFLYTLFVLVTFKKNKIGEVAARKVLVVLATCVNFIIILHSSFSYESVLQSFSLVTVWRTNFLGKEYRHKSCS